MQKNYYQNIQYPLQDKILRILEILPVDFYLTGGTALSRHSAKDVVDIVYIALNYSFNWVEIIKEASKKDIWINAVEASKILDSFPLNKLEEITWINHPQDLKIFEKQLQLLIGDLLTGQQNSLCEKKETS